MKVNLAAQTLSSSVADALEFCNVTLKLPQFNECEATVKFIRIIDRLFDLLNSRNPLARGYKAPLRQTNEQFWMSFLDDAYDYLSTLKDANDTYLCDSKRKTGFLGLLCDVLSVKNIYIDIIQKTNMLKYLLTYKLSQDHLELFFSAVRSAGGYNNSPTARQFASAYKRLLMRHNVEASINANVTSLDSTTILTSSNIDIQCDDLNVTLARRYDIVLRQPQEKDHDYVDIPNYGYLSHFKMAVVTYIAGYVVNMVLKKIICEFCRISLTCDNAGGTIGGLFMKLKSRGGLRNASESVIVVCEATERCFNRMKNVVPHLNIVPAITSVVLEETGTKVFTSLNNHMFDCSPFDNHIFKLIKCITECYCKISLHHIAKQQTDTVTGLRVRKELSKLVLFKHQ